MNKKLEEIRNKYANANLTKMFQEINELLSKEEKK
jgi:hypothetical protein